MTRETLTNWMLGIAAAVLILSIFAMLDEQQEQADAEAYKQEAIKQAQEEKKQLQRELRALSIEAEYMTGVRMVSK